MVFPPLDAEKIKDDLDLERLGWERGKDNKPTLDSRTFDDVETQIISYVDRARISSIDILQDNITTYTQRLVALESDAATSDIDGEAVQVLSEFRTKLSTGADRLYIARKSVTAAEQQLESFIHRNRIERLAHYPEAKTLHIGILLFIVIIEALLNGFFIGETHTLGISGGVMEALAIAVVNVSISFIVGLFVLPQFNHVSKARKVFAILVFFTCLPVIAGFNLGVAHYRDALSAGNWDDATRAALETFLTSPIGVVDLKSWMLFIMGIIFSVIALREGYCWDDVYPGYGGMYRRRCEVLEEYSAVKEECLDELHEIKAEAVEAMQSVKNELIKRTGEFGTIIEARQRLCRAYEEHLLHLEQVADDLLTTYREANRRARTEPEPSRFSDHWQLESPKAPALPEFDLGKKRESVAITVKALDRRIVEVHQAFDTAVDTFRRIEQLTKEELARGSAQAIIQAAA